jgi:hypothetical protein
MIKLINLLKEILEIELNKAEQALEKIKKLSTDTYRHTGLIFGDYGMSEIYVVNNTIKIGTLTSFKKGGGKWILNNIIQICNKYSVPIKLLAQSYKKDSDIEYVNRNIKDERPELSQSELIKMYKNLGFTVLNKSSKSAEMIKYPLQQK